MGTTSKNVNAADTSLADIIKRLSPKMLSYNEAAQGARNLVDFFELLTEIDAEHGITRPRQNQGQP